MSKCQGCGVKLQDTDALKIGYTPKITNDYCLRCFQTIHYNKEQKVNVISQEIIIDKINKLGFTTFFITDLFSLNADVIKTFKMINNEKILVINKLDLIPSNLNIKHLLENIKASYNISNDIYFISGKKDFNLNELIKKIEEKKHVIFCGETSSGKSTLINTLVGSKLTTSKYSNTTLDFIKINYLDYLIYDTPGFIINGDKENIEGIKMMTKQMSDDYILNISDCSFKCNGNLTLFINKDALISTKKSKENLPKQKVVLSNSDIVLGDGFIYIKKETAIEYKGNIEIRKSIIGG